MSADLYAITNSSLSGNETVKDWEAIVQKLKGLDLNSRTLHGVNSERVLKRHWGYEINPCDENTFNVEFYGPCYIVPSLYPNVGVIYNTHRYTSLFYFQEQWFQNFRFYLYKVTRIIGGSEVIFLTDCFLDELVYYLEEMAFKNVPYSRIKQAMTKEFGTPKNIGHYDERSEKDEDLKFFWDDFSDLK